MFEQGANAGATKSGVFDIILMDDPSIPFFAENGHLEDLTSYFNAIGVPGPDNDFLGIASGLPQSLQYRTVRRIPYVGNAQMFSMTPQSSPSRVSPVVRRPGTMF